MLLSRFINDLESFSWHVITSELSSPTSNHLEPVVSHQVRLQNPQDFAVPVTPIKLGYFHRLRVTFPLPEGQKKKDKAFEVVIFNQKHNPQTSVGKILTNIKREGISLREIFSPKGLAVLAFLATLTLFIINSRFCPEDSDYYKKKDEAYLLRENAGGASTIEGETLLAREGETWVDSVCRLKSSVVTNLVVAFLFLTVIRQVMIRTQRSNDHR